MIMFLIPSDMQYTPLLFWLFLGLGSLYGEQHLPDDRMDRQSELRLVEKCLGDYFQTCM